MEFTLTYQGILRANGSLKDKQAIRRELHKQFLKLWDLPPLNEYLHDDKYFKDVPANGGLNFVREVGGFKFVPLVNAKFYLLCEIAVTLLRPEPPGSIITQSGDIDNRLKTLFDALRMPKTTDEIPKGDFPREDEGFFFCLLEDDNLISRISVDTDTLLEPTVASSSHVHLLLKVRTRTVRVCYGNLGLI
jgi:hypothetical protein